MAMEVKLSFSVSIVIAVVIAQVISIFWYSDSAPWGRWGDRYWISSIVSDIGLAFILQALISNYWSVRKWEDAAMMSMWLTLLFACLEAPHFVEGPRTFSSFMFHCGHKFVMMFAMSFALKHFQKY